MKNLSLYADFIKIRIKAIVEYPGAFWMTNFSKSCGWAADIIVVYLMVYRFQNVMGWGTYEMLLLYAMNVCAYALAGFFMFHPFTRLSEHIRNGTFDEMLTKPLNPFVYLCCREFSTGYIPNLVVGTITMIICFVNLNIQLDFFGVLYLLLALLGGGLIHSAFFIFSGVPAFWLIKVNALSKLRSTLEGFIRYPISIYDGWIQVLLTFIFPFAFINFYPLQYFLPQSGAGIAPIFSVLTPIVGIILFGLGYLFFKLGIKSYNSTGS